MLNNFHKSLTKIFITLSSNCSSARPILLKAISFQAKKQGKVKGKVHLRTGHEGPKGE
jgi:hypothetical protein